MNKPRELPLTEKLHHELTLRSEKRNWVVGTAYVEMKDHAASLECTVAELRGLLDTCTRRMAEAIDDTDMHVTFIEAYNDACAFLDGSKP